MSSIYEYSSDYDEITDYLDWLYEDVEGYVYIARREVGGIFFKQYFYQWPSERQRISTFIFAHVKKGDVYIAPALFAEASALKSNVLGSNVAWCEFDGNEPITYGDFPKPHFRIQSSTAGHTHCYWKLPEFTPTEALEEINRSLTHYFEADVSGWDANQILRPPSTWNHKRDTPVFILEFDLQSRIHRNEIENLPDPPAKFDGGLEMGEIPDITDVLNKYSLPSRTNVLFRSGPASKDRSDGLMSLCYDLAELGMTAEEMFAVLLNADERWGKFKYRDDRFIRLSEIIIIALKKYPTETETKPTAPKFQIDWLKPGVSFKNFNEVKVEVDWAVDTIALRNSMVCLVGPPGAGKSQLSLNFCIAVALGRKFLSWKVARPFRVGFLSLEMGDFELRPITSRLSGAVGPESVEMLDNNFIMWSIGHGVPFDDKDAQKQLTAKVKEHELDCLVVDSLGRCIGGSLKDDDSIRPALEFVQTLMIEENLFSFIVHHDRKAPSGHKSGESLDDVFGSRYISAIASSIGYLSPRSPDTVSLGWLKTRNSRLPDKTLWKRDENFLYVPLNSGSNTNVVPPEKPGTESIGTLELKME